MKKQFLTLCCCITIFSWAFTQPSSYIVNNPAPFNRLDNTYWADSIFLTLTPQQRIAQLFMVAAYSDNRADEKTLNNLIETYGIGGLIFMQGTPDAQMNLINRYQAKSQVPLMIAMDLEWGLAFRLKKTIRFQKNMTLGAIQEDELIYEFGRELGRQCKRIGVHVNFAPVLDVNNNRENPVINVRSFGEDRYNVTRKAYAFMTGLQEEKVLAVGKHFPGHGDTSVDSHLDLPVLNFSPERLDSLELYPFKKLTSYGIGGMMTAHLNVPSLAPNDVSATTSKTLTTGILKDQIGFDGLIFTDALNMAGITKYYQPGEADLQALLAGNDILLFPLDVPTAIARIEQAVQEGLISQSEIDKRVKKILRAKQWVGLDQPKTLSTKGSFYDLNNDSSEALKHQLATASMTLVKDDHNLIPIKGLDTIKIASVAIGASRQTSFQEYGDKYLPIDDFYLSNNATPQQRSELIRKLAPYDIVLVSKHDNSTRASKKFGTTAESVAFLNELPPEKRVIFTYFGIPYGVTPYNLSAIDALLVAYEDDEYSQTAAIQAIFGGQTVDGKLSVSISPEYPAGTGLVSFKNRLGYSTPEAVGMDSEVLKKIDVIVQNAIANGATPGCQVLVARKGNVIFNKSYGYHTYNKKKKVQNSHLYDLASITKVTAMVPTLMQLYDQSLFSLEAPLSQYLPALKGTDKSQVTTKEILAHQAGLKAWIPFYQYLIDTSSYTGNLMGYKKNEKYNIQVDSRAWLNNEFRFRNDVFSSEKKGVHTKQVGKDLYLNRHYVDSIIYQIAQSESKGKNYRYSDLGFILFGETVKELTDKDLKQYTHTHFFEKLGATKLGYQPLSKFSIDNIVPTAQDNIIRKQLVHGYVHDPTAALMGGVAGHAGLFSNAEDLAKLWQMYLQGGNYGGEQFIKPETIQYFSQQAYANNRRGIGFDKAEPDSQKKNPYADEASTQGYGHTGFTGNMIWADPESELLYIFLSNRVYPHDWNKKLIRMGVRTDIQSTVYQAITRKTEKTKRIEIVPLETQPIEEVSSAKAM